MQRPLKLITALGYSPDLILQFIDFFNGGETYRYKQEAAAIRKNFAGQELVAVYLICTKEQRVVDSLAQLREIVGTDYPGLAAALHPIDLPCNDITCGEDDETMRQLVYEAVRSLAADDLIISSGGRKPVTQRLIEAGLLYGCRGYLTITADRNKEKRACSESFHVLWTSARRFSEERRARIIKDELGDNFRSLYLLPANIIDRLRRERLGVEPAQSDEELAWLRRLPKADLHCHLGGAFDAVLLKELAAKLLEECCITAESCKAIRTALEHRLGKPLAVLAGSDLLRLRREKKGNQVVHPLQNLDVLFQGRDEPPHILTAVLVNSLSSARINEISWHEPDDLAPDDRLRWYMACGDLGGSNLLQTDGTLRLALRWLMEESRRENVRFLEVRFSPDNYTRAGLSILHVIETLLDEARSFMAANAGFHVNFLIMATRHKEKAAMDAHVAAAVIFGRPDGATGTPRITGFDLAGQEKDNDPMLFQESFMPLHRHFINITIHAGEMEEDDRIWQALYLLHAKRIGHGLKLINNEKMMGYVRDYGIAIEMCPSSNVQTNRFLCFDGSDETGDVYPLKAYFDKGLTVTVNTDNRGISRTTLSEEYLHAARLTEGGLSRWEILRLAKNSFKAAFLPKDEKDRLLKEIDDAVFALLLDDFFPREQ
ncbi:MAG: hypothetical protein ACOY4H_00555 [Thermodesulfobacteriota bacterium]